MLALPACHLPEDPSFLPPLPSIWEGHYSCLMPSFTGISLPAYLCRRTMTRRFCEEEKENYMPIWEDLYHSVPHACPCPAPCLPAVCQHSFPILTTTLSCHHCLPYKFRSGEGETGQWWAMPMPGCLCLFCVGGVILHACCLPLGRNLPFASGPEALYHSPCTHFPLHTYPSTTPPSLITSPPQACLPVLLHREGEDRR